MLGRQAFGITLPIIRKGDDINNIIIDATLPYVESGDIIGITESIIARAEGNYVTIDKIASEIKNLNFENLPIRVLNPIYSRNRFALILKAIARSTSSIEIIMPKYDEVGNPRNNHPFTGMDYDKYYEEICLKEGVKECHIYDIIPYDTEKVFTIDCSLRPSSRKYDRSINLTHLCSNQCKYGLLGSNRANDETLKLFPESGDAVVNYIQNYYAFNGKDVEVMIYGDGCFKDPVGGIWEFADPVTSPAYTSGLEGTPNEIKLKAFADDKYANLSGDELSEAIKSEIRSKASDLVNNMSSQGTTPRRKIDLLASLMDLISGSGDAGTPVVIIRNYNHVY